ncbi:MAG: hypothetical protein ABWZ53_05385 [Actinomycetota bacterium]
MSTRVGTLQAPRAGGPILLAAFLASFVILIVAISLQRDQGRQGETTFVGRHMVNTPSELSAGIVGGAEQTFVGGTAANTPSELNAPIGAGRPKTVAGGTLANTPTELSGGIRHKFVSDTLGTNTPTELTGGFIMVNGHKRTVPLS